MLTFGRKPLLAMNIFPRINIGGEGLHTTEQVARPDHPTVVATPGKICSNEGHFMQSKSIIQM